jgi:hypothetical protein
MGVGLTHIGATQGIAAYSATASRTRTAGALDRMHAESLRAVRPVAEPRRQRDQIRDQVLADRGLDRIDLFKLGPQARLEAEISIDAETAWRAREARARDQVRATARFVDIRI